MTKTELQHELYEWLRSKDDRVETRGVLLEEHVEDLINSYRTRLAYLEDWKRRMAEAAED